MFLSTRKLYSWIMRTTSQKLFMPFFTFSKAFPLCSMVLEGNNAKEKSSKRRRTKKENTRLQMMKKRINSLRSKNS